LILAHDLKYADTVELQTRLDVVSRMLEAYIRAINQSRGRLGAVFYWLLAPGIWLLS
jgi:hypothetical protein